MKQVIFSAYIVGFQAKSTRENPFKPNTQSWFSWMEGYYDK